jgi:hypothetical protein
LNLSEETQKELLYTAKLHNKHRGELAEFAFMRKAAGRGLAVAKPWGDSERYDFVVRVGKVFWRVQVKSVLPKSPQRTHYRISTTGSLKTTYSSDDIDFLVAYIFPEDTWYIFPASVVAKRKSLCVIPRSRSRFEIYREAWSLMVQTCTEPQMTVEVQNGTMKTPSS